MSQKRFERLRWDDLQGGHSKACIATYFDVSVLLKIKSSGQPLSLKRGEMKGTALLNTILARLKVSFGK